MIASSVKLSIKRNRSKDGNKARKAWSATPFVIILSRFCHVGWLTLICKKHPLTEDRLQLLDVLGDAVSQWLLQGENHRCFFGKVLLFQQLIAKQPVDAKLLSQTMAAMYSSAIPAQVPIR